MSIFSKNFGPYSKLRTANWPIARRKQTEPYTKRCYQLYSSRWACLHEGGGPQIGEVTCRGSPRLSRKRDQIKIRDYVDRRVTHQSGLPHLLKVVPLRAIYL